MSLSLPRRQFSSLSVKDLLDAREAYHVHLMHMENVVATAIGRYRFLADEVTRDGREPPERVPRGIDTPRTLENSAVQSYSWPCVMVFVDRWIPTADFAAKKDEIVPPRLYLPDGRVVPTCVIHAEKQDAPVEQIGVLTFPETVLGGGYPSISDVQGQTRVATIGCLMSDGDSYYALTNAHVAGEPGRELFTLVGTRRELLGRTAAGKSLTRIPFERAYEGFVGPHSVVNVDAALVRIDDITRWTSQIYGIGQFGETADLNADTINLDLIGCPVVAFGASSGLMHGEIQGLFYRYRSVGGQDQLADILIGRRHRHDPRTKQEMPRTDADPAPPALGRHGNSGAVWFLEQKLPGKSAQAGGKTVLRPIALHWGGQRFVDGGSKTSQYALASSLGIIQRELGVEIVRDLNIGLPETWGKTGHYKVAQLACRLKTESRLAALLAANLDRISYEVDIVHATANPSPKDEFIALADVPDLAWKRGGKSTRGKEEPNHFADMDQPSPSFQNRTLLTLSKQDAFVDPARWNQFYESLGIRTMQRGVLPFRVWQLFDVMAKAVADGDLAGCVCAAGVLSHYVGDACQPLHVSMYYDGDPQTGSGGGIHSAYEIRMLDRKAPDINARIDKLVADAPPKLSKIVSGLEAAKATIALMGRSIDEIKPADLIEVYGKSHDTGKLFDHFGDATANRLLDGAKVLASIWAGAWKAGGGPAKFSAAELGAVPKQKLSELYLDKDWAKSATIKDMKRDGSELEIV